jgi:carboxyl-terminal processing protease
MKVKSIYVVLAILATLLLLTGTFSAGFVAGGAVGNPLRVSLAQYFPQLGIQDNSPIQESTGQGGTPQDLEELFRPFWQSWDVVKEVYVDQPVDQELMMRGAIRGMLESLGDEHTSYLDPKTFEETRAVLDGTEYEGIGAWVDIRGDYLTIISPMPGSPAERAGLKSGDQVIAINGEDMTGIDGELVRQRILGPKGTKVTMTIHRAGETEPLVVEIVRASIVVPSVIGEMKDNNIAYVRLMTFGSDTNDDLKTTLKELLAQKPSGLVLDLRNNGGGYLDTAIEVVSQFIGNGVVMNEENGDGRREVYQAKPGGLATDIPLVVLINQGTASASEIVAGAIQDRGRGYLVGATSYGKGSVQNSVVLVNDEGAIRVTTAKWLTPNDRQINKLGLQPDFLVELTEEDVAANHDTQLEMAMNVLIKHLLPPPTPVPSPTLTSTPTP